jgi:phytoene synthase
VPAAARPAVEALWRLDVTLGAVLATGRDPMVSRIRLAWWRESLERLDSAPSPAEPVLQALAAHVLPRGVSGAELAAMEAGWAELLADGPLDEAGLAAYASSRGGRLFRLCARLLGGGDDGLGEAGACWALADLARRSSNPAEARAALDLAARAAVEGFPRGRLAPLGMLMCLAKRDIERGAADRERQGSPARMARLMAFRLFGR